MQTLWKDFIKTLNIIGSGFVDCEWYFRYHIKGYAMIFRNSRIDVAFFILLLNLSLLLNFYCTDSVNMKGASDILEKISFESISIYDISDALPRLREETILFRLKGGNNNFLKRYHASREDTLRKALIVGAAFYAVKWEWGFLKKQGRQANEMTLDSLRFSIEQNLSTVNHEIKSIGAPKELLSLIDHVKINFGASTGKYSDVLTLGKMFDQISNRLHQFFLIRTDSYEAYSIGGWLVDEAELSNLYFLVDDDYFKNHILNMINKKYKDIDIIRFIATLESLMASVPSKTVRLPKFETIFPVSKSADVLKIHATILDTFRALDILFPKI